MSDAREGHGETVLVPPPFPPELVRRRWHDVPELACAAAWGAACAAWWSDAEDRRLRKASFDALWLDDGQLQDWLRRSLDTSVLLRAHGHVTAMRAGVERDLSRRVLVTGELRSDPVWTDHHDGTRRMFVAAEEVPRQLQRAYAGLRQLPEHPFLRAAWVSQVLGAIHPFRDANGGTARFLSSLELLRSSLPPLVLSPELRNGAYIRGLAIADSLDPLAVAVYEAVQQTLAITLLAGRARCGEWSERSRARTARWAAMAVARVRAVVGGELEGGRSTAPAVSRLVRSGYRLPASPAADCLTAPVAAIAASMPASVDLAIVPVRGGASSWLLAIIAARVGERGELGMVGDREHVPMYFIAPEHEDDDNVDARFARWLDTRSDQIVRGLARWT